MTGKVAAALKAAVAALEGPSRRLGECVVCEAKHAETHAPGCALRLCREALACTRVYVGRSHA